MIEKLTKEFSFAERDFDTFGVRNSAVLKIFQDVAVEHANLLGVGFDDLIRKKMLWVTIKIKYEIMRQPNPNEALTIETYPSEKNLLEYYRNYLIYDANNNLIIKGLAKWCVISSETRKICSLKNFEVPSFDFGDVIFEEKPHRLRIFEPEFLPDNTYQIFPDDIDSNGHMNNTVYAKIVDKMISGNTNQVLGFEIDFLKETFVGQRLDMFKLKENGDLKILGKICEDKPSFVVGVHFKDQ